jgi:hypothetical protein
MAWVYVILFIIAGILIVVYVPRLLLKRAMRQTVKTFRRNGATNPNAALPLKTMALNNPSILQSMMKTRDYKPMAVDILIREGIVIAEGDKYYLSEAKLAGSALTHKIGVPPPNKF